MIFRGRPKPDLLLKSEERGKLITLSRQRRNPVLARRARIVLKCAEGKTNHAVATAEHISPRTVGKWRERFVRYRLRGLADAPRPGAPRKISDAAIGRVVELTLAGRGQQPPAISTRMLAHACGMSRDAVHRIWRTLGLEPPNAEAWRQTERHHVAGCETQSCDVVGILLHPLGRVLALCLEDENCACNVRQSVASAARNHAGAWSAGTAPQTSRSHLAVLVALEKVAGARQHPSALQPPTHAFAGCLMRLDGALPPTMRVRLVVSGFALHRSEEARDWLDRHCRFDFWLIPSHLAWIAYASAWLARGMAALAMNVSSYPGAQQLCEALAAYCEPGQQSGEPFVWFAAPEVMSAMDAKIAAADISPALA